MRSAFAILLLGTIASADSRLPAHYAKLFDAKATWTYDVTPPGGATTQVTCKVARVSKFGAVTASEVVCDAFGDELPIANVYLARKDGLYTSGLGFPATRDEIGDFSVHAFLIAARPKVSSKTVRRYGLIDDKPIAVDTIFETKREGKMWCWVRTTRRSATSTTDTRCFSGTIDHGSAAGLAFQLR